MIVIISCQTEGTKPFKRAADHTYDWGHLQDPQSVSKPALHARYILQLVRAFAGHWEGRMEASIQRLEFEDFPGRTLTVLLFKDVTNSK